jgi:hypothetical protein
MQLDIHALCNFGNVLTHLDIFSHTKFLDGSSPDDWVAFMQYLDATLEIPAYVSSQSDAVVEHASAQVFKTSTQLPYEEVWL